MSIRLSDEAQQPNKASAKSKALFLFRIFHLREKRLSKTKPLWITITELLPGFINVKQNQEIKSKTTKQSDWAKQTDWSIKEITANRNILTQTSKNQWNWTALSLSSNEPSPGGPTDNNQETGNKNKLRLWSLSISRGELFFKIKLRHVLRI